METVEVAARQIVSIGRKLYERGLIVGSEGNISVCLDAGRVLVTPSGLPKGDLEPEQMVLVDMNGNHLEGEYRASSELPMHLAVYRNRPEIHCCVHSHAPYATAFATSGRELPANVLPEIVLFVGKIPLTEYAPPGTEAVAESLRPFLSDSSAFLLRNHGLLTIGENPDRAFLNHETVEHYARIVYLAGQLGGAKSIPTADCERLERARRERQDTGASEDGSRSR